ncbi:SMI1/KNR4 family protein [Dactylosporangium sp. NPDC048998]|uniref:SMI1/KNR4 family protein n=1 Tax=Dactylosporangium sp. NPDC048998 TaxID=3363976 RepID=UPI00370FF8F6
MTQPPVPQPPIPGARYALTVFRPPAPVLRVRYRDGVVVGGHGYPVWTPYARALVDLPDPPAGRCVDELRVLDVLAANEALAAAGSPLAAPDRATPHGWTWAHLGRSRRIALVPIDLHASFAHLGGVATMGADRSRRGVDVAGAPGVGQASGVRLPEAALRQVEESLGHPLPAQYRQFLLDTNGARPAVPAVHPGFGFVADQYFFGFARQDWMEDPLYAGGWFRDRLTDEFLVAGYVQGGLIALRVRGDDAGSVWYLDDDDPRDADTFDAEYRSAHLLHRLADDFGQFWSQLRAVPYWLRRLAWQLVAEGRARLAEAEDAGRSLPRSLRPAELAHEPPALVPGARPEEG